MEFNGKTVLITGGSLSDRKAKIDKVFREVKSFVDNQKWLHASLTAILQDCTGWGDKEYLNCFEALRKKLAIQDFPLRPEYGFVPGNRNINSLIREIGHRCKFGHPTAIILMGTNLDKTPETLEQIARAFHYICHGAELKIPLTIIETTSVQKLPKGFLGNFDEIIDLDREKEETTGAEGETTPSPKPSLTTIREKALSMSDVITRIYSAGTIVAHLFRWLRSLLGL